MDRPVATGGGSAKLWPATHAALSRNRHRLLSRVQRARRRLTFGEQLLDWLNKYTFPTEQKYSDKEFARSVAKMHSLHPDLQV